MKELLPEIVLVRHGETVWSKTGQHTGRTDLPLTEVGEDEARSLTERLSGIHFDRVLVSPLQRAQETCQLAGFLNFETIPDLAELHYGAFEGLTAAEIQKQHPGWTVFRDGSLGGESVDQIIQRGERVAEFLKSLNGRTLIFSHGHFSRVIAAKWCGFELDVCNHLSLATTHFAVLGFERNKTLPVIRHWNLRDLSNR
ncbi:histidine phosphatase family protein [Planctomicrobium sp. SH668]|uniref:histidine phosphatase family protein n=1 Tax=Planctomicrobium sp. SH668 TaxID=3448126 RepID=UPI003F5BF6A4